MRLLNKYFETSGDVTIDDEGLVSCTGQVVLKQVHQHTTLPVAFGRIDGGFYCHNNQLTTLAGAPQTVGGSFWCDYNSLTTLAGAPQTVGGDFYCRNNQLTTLAGAPQTVGGDFRCDYNSLTTLAGAPQTVRGGFYCYNNPLAILQGMPTQLRKLRVSYSPNLPLLRTLYAQEIEFFPKPHDPALLGILNRYAGQGKRGAIKCQKELISAGFERNARW
jgi:hypothetical protein